MGLTKEEQMIIWNTKTIKAFNELNFDNILYSSDVNGTEGYIIVGKDKKHIEGYEAMKTHKGEKVPTRYFIRTQDIKDMPLQINKTHKVHSKGNVYNLVTDCNSISVPPRQIYNWREIIDSSGIPTHSNSLHYILYKIKVLYGRIKGQYYYRTITESAFGKDKYKESVRLLLNDCSLLSDPTVANLFYRACHNRDITINELPDTKNKSEFIKLCNMLIRIGDGSNVIDNRARSIVGTSDTADTSLLSVSFTHNIPKYYHDKGEKCFDDIYPYNVINRYYYNLYEGFLQAKFPDNINYEDVAKKYELYLREWIQSVLWYEKEFPKLSNKFDYIPLFDFKFSKHEERFKDHFTDTAFAISYYAKDEKEYLEMLHEEYNSHKNYENLVVNNGFVSASEYKQEELV